MRMLEAGVTAESESGMKGLTLYSFDGHETLQSACHWEETSPHVRSSSFAKKPILQSQRPGNPIPRANKPSKKDLEHCPLKANKHFSSMIIIPTLSHK